MFLYIHKGAEKVKPYGVGAHCSVEELCRWSYPPQTENLAFRIFLCQTHSRICFISHNKSSDGIIRKEKAWKSLQIWLHRKSFSDRIVQCESDLRRKHVIFELWIEQIESAKWRESRINKRNFKNIKTQIEHILNWNKRS